MVNGKGLFAFNIEFDHFKSFYVVLHVCGHPFTFTHWGQRLQGSVCSLGGIAGDHVHSCTKASA